MEPNPLHSRVRRRLFDDETTEECSSLNDSSKQLVDLCDVMDHQENTTENLDVTPNENDDISTQQKEVLCLNHLLIVTNDHNSESFHLLEENTKRESEWFEIKYCQSSNALHHTHQQAYKTIWTDIDLSPDSEMLRVICSIRKSSISNTRTPIIAICQNHSRRGADNLFYYGISFVCYGKLSAHIYDDLQERLKEYDPNQTTVIDVTPVDDDVVIIEDFTKIKELEFRLSEPTATETFATLTTVAQQQRINTGKTFAPPTYSFVESDVIPTSTLNRPIYFPDKVGQFDQRQAHIVRPIIQRPLFRPLQKPIHLLPKPKVYQQFFTQPMDVRAFPYKNGTDIQSKQNPEISYVASSEPSGNNVTILPDDLTKHSTKERMRRERIKYCCEQFRELLPKGQLNNNTKKVDMATVMELTVFYIKMLQKNSTSYCQQQCSQVFEFYFNQLSGKRSCADADDASPTNPLKVIRTEPQRSNEYIYRPRLNAQSSFSCHSTQQPSTTSKTTVAAATIPTTTSIPAKSQRSVDMVENPQSNPQNSTQRQQGVHTAAKLVQTQLHQPQLQTTYYPADHSASHPPSAQVPLMPQGYRYIDQQHHYTRPHYHQPMEYYGMAPVSNIYEGTNAYQQNHVIQQSTMIGSSHAHAQKEMLFQQNVLINNQNEQPPSNHYIPSYKYH